MHRTRRTCHPGTTLSVLAVLAFGCAGPPIGPDDGHVGPSEARASRAITPMRIDATVALGDPVVPPLAPCLAMFPSVIEGEATHLGRLTGVGSTCILSQVGPEPDPPFRPAGPGPYAVAEFSNPRWTLTAANGDELWMESIVGVAVISLVDGSLRAEGRQRIIGGTGRFARATGEVQAVGVNPDGLGPDDYRSRGWIRFDASNRRRER